VVEIPYNTFQKYLRGKEDSRIIIWYALGRPRLITKEDAPFVVDVLARKDRANEGLSMAEALSMIQDVLPKLSREQVYNSFKRKILAKNKSVLKAKPVVAQSTTTKRSGITVGQKFRWFKCYNGVLDRLRQLNKGVCNLTGNTFGEVIQNFIYGGDETCFQACGNGKVKVFSSRGKK
jgi:hypothetical protein